MFEFIREHQLNIMLSLCSICAMMTGLLLITRFLPKRRKWILILMELIATCLLQFDRAAYIYRGNVTRIGYIMVRVSNFMVFFLTSAVVLSFNLYLMDLLWNEGQAKRASRRLKAVNFGAAIGMALVVLSQFTGLYYSFDSQNRYQRGPGFLICYILPIALPLIQYTVIHQYRKAFSRLIYVSLVLFIFVPIIAAIVQIFTYGISIVNMAMVLVSVSLYIFAYLDINDEVERAHEIEVENLQKERQSMKRLFDQTATAFVMAVEKRDDFSEGHSVRVADFAEKIARASGKNEKECDEVYYAALLHDVGTIGISDAVIEKAADLNDAEYAEVKQKPVLSAEILASIVEYPYLSDSARYHCERYDGSGYPEGLSGKNIPEISRIIAVADAYDNMTSRKRFREPLSYQVVREELIKQSGTQFDPEFAEIMVQIMDADLAEKEKVNAARIETELDCGEYKRTVSTGIPVTEEIINIQFEYEESKKNAGDFSAPSIILFDSYDRRTHYHIKTVEAYHYLEFGEIWFDGHYVSTSARNMKVHIGERESATGGNYAITAGRFEDHLSIQMISPARVVDIILALPDNSKASYIGLTGENCHMRNIAVQKTGNLTAGKDFEKIVSPILYTNRLESDVPNIQVDRHRSASTKGIPIHGELQLDFHAMSLPSADLVWHCPYIVLFYSDDKKVGSAGYREYALIKINGEGSADDDFAENQFFMKKTEDFPGWDTWKAKNKEGLECSVRFRKKGNKVVTITETLGISIENTTVIKDGVTEVYAALTGDQVALTDIRLR